MVRLPRFVRTMQIGFSSSFYPRISSYLSLNRGFSLCPFSLSSLLLLSVSVCISILFWSHIRIPPFFFQKCPYLGNTGQKVWCISRRPVDIYIYICRHIYIYVHIYRVLTWIRNQTRVFTWFRHHFVLQVHYFGPCHVFNEFRVFCWNLCFLVLCSNSAYIPGFWARCFKPFFIDIFKVCLWNANFCSIWGLAPIDWTSKRLLQSFNFSSFCVAFSKICILIPTPKN